MDIVEARVGTILRDKWHVDSLIGVGGMAAVYAATHRNGNRVALKVLHAQLSVDGNIRSRFKREGYVANMISHPGIVRVLDDDVTEDGSVFLVMDLLEGETTEARAQRLGGRLPLEDVLLVGDGLLDVIAAAHAAGVVHRDIKPENVFITLERDVKVLDFGIAGLRDGFAQSGVKTAAMMGTPAFMPPEQALGRMKEVDSLSDVWAVGATLFNLVSGQLVHEAETANELLVLAATAVPRSLSDASADAPGPLVEIVDRALAVDKANRWSSARAMQHALRQAAAEILRAPLPAPHSSRARVQTAPRAFRPPGIESSPALDDTLVGHEGEWSVKSGVSAARPGAFPNAATPPGGVPRVVVAPRPDTSTFHGMDAAVEPRASSGKRVLILAAVCTALVGIVGSIGVGLALRHDAVAIPPVTAPANAVAARQAPLPAPTSEPAALATAPAPTASTAPSSEPAPEASAAAPKPADKISSPAPNGPRPAGKKSWLDRRK